MQSEPLTIIGELEDDKLMESALLTTMDHSRATSLGLSLSHKLDVLRSYCKTVLAIPSTHLAIRSGALTIPIMMVVLAGCEKQEKAEPARGTPDYYTTIYSQAGDEKKALYDSINIYTQRDSLSPEEQKRVNIWVDRINALEGKQSDLLTEANRLRIDLNDYGVETPEMNDDYNSHEVFEEVVEEAQMEPEVEVGADTSSTAQDTLSTIIPDTEILGLYPVEPAPEIDLKMEALVEKIKRETELPVKKTVLQELKKKLKRGL